MKQFTISLIALVCASALANTDVIPSDRPTLTLINHYKTNLAITVSNSIDTPGFPSSFSLQQGQKITTDVLYLGSEANADPCSGSENGGSNAYIHIQAIPIAASLQAGTQPSAFFGAGLTCLDRSLVQVSGWVDNQVAYSYSYSPTRHNVVTFCAKEDFKNDRCS